MLYRTLICGFLLMALAGLAPAQNSRNNGLTRTNAENGRPGEREDEDTRIGSPEAEMIRRRQIEYEKKIHQEHLARAHEASRLGSALQETFTRQQTLEKEDLKKLEKLEKLARRIREHFGGDDDAATLENPPNNLTDAFTRLKDLAAELDKEVSETPRQVISTEVIVKACEVEALARFVRERLQKKDK